MRTIFHLLCAILFCALMTGCGLNNFGMGPTPRQNVPVDEHPYAPEQKEYEQ